MENENVTEKDREMAQVCLNCFFGKMVRQEQKGLLYDCARSFADKFCPFGQAYEKVFGRKVYEPIPAQ